MADLAPGLRVIIRDEEWMIKRIEKNSFNQQSIYCIGISPLVKDKESIFLSDLEQIDVVDPVKTKLIADTSPSFRKSKLFIESALRQQIPTDSKLCIGQKAAMDLMEYQLVPANMALSSPRQRILIADSVGLGKTLEAGILMSELIARGKGKRILVVTVKSMMMQFQKEMWNRFSIPLVRLDSNKIQRIRANLPSNYNPFFYYDKTIVSIDTLKRDVEYRTHLEQAYWDIIVIDEAHNVAERGQHQAQRAKLAQLLSKRSDTLILLSATPHDGRAESFASLMNMLDPTAIADIHHYTKEDIKGLCIRRFKKDVNSQLASSFKDREVSIQKCYASMYEEFAFDYFADMKLEMDKGGTQGIGTLFKTSLEKAMFSSPAACIKSIDERVKKLVAKYGEGNFIDIETLRKLKVLLEDIKAEDFSRYQELLALLNSKEYGWNKNNTEDRIVIFTERIETMKWLANQLRKDLKMPTNSIQEMYGGMSDVEQQKIVDDFGRKESPIRILVASDVASEGINLHYLSHRLIHFDIPWSLMVFQQRNGRIDRYGQKVKPDIRYFLIQSNNSKINGDTRIMHILIQKEEQAYKNIGDPALLMGKFNVEEEELETAAAIEKGTDAEEFGQTLDTSSEEFNPFEILMQQTDDEASKPIEVVEKETLFTDLTYLKYAIGTLQEEDRYLVRDLSTVQGVELKLSDEMKKRLKASLPDESLPDDDKLKLSPDKNFIMKEMARCMQNDLSENAWPSAQYLWKLHPIFNWINDKVGLLFGRGEAPVLGFKSNGGDKKTIYIVSGTVFNRKSTPVIDEWFGLVYKNNKFEKALSMKELIESTRLNNMSIPNENLVTKEILSSCTSSLGDAIAQVRKLLDTKCDEYKDKNNPILLNLLDRLEELHNKHFLSNEIDVEQVGLFDDANMSAKARLLRQKKNKIDEIFEEYEKWYTDTIEIEKQPYIKVVAVLTEV